MVRLTIDLPEGAVSAMRRDPEALAKEMRLAAAAKWYELRLISQERAAEIAGLARSEFLTELGRMQVSAFQYEPGELAAEAGPEGQAAAWREWAASHRPIPVIADDSRESIYAGRGE